MAVQGDSAVYSVACSPSKAHIEGVCSSKRREGSCSPLKANCFVEVAVLDAEAGEVSIRRKTVE